VCLLCFRALIRAVLERMDVSLVSVAYARFGFVLCVRVCFVACARFGFVLCVRVCFVFYFVRRVQLGRYEALRAS